MAITPARERVAKSRARRKRGLHPVQITVPDEVIDLLLARGYDLTRTDKASMDTPRQCAQGPWWSDQETIRRSTYHSS
jgi:hypothetical protein